MNAIQNIGGSTRLLPGKLDLLQQIVLRGGSRSVWCMGTRKVLECACRYFLEPGAYFDFDGSEAHSALRGFYLRLVRAARRDRPHGDERSAGHVPGSDRSATPRQG
jgi:hypothetical protein